jgi:hypothetical protein
MMNSYHDIAELAMAMSKRETGENWLVIVNLTYICG